jgi:uncharacterized protein YdhG (YjbR/CyaY superfamily)
MNLQFKTIDEYIQTFPKDIQGILEQIRHTIHETAPDATETISYQMPAFKLNGKTLVYFAAWKEHIGFYALPSGNEAFKKELANYTVSKGAIQFPLDKPMPYELIKKIVEFRVKELS